MTAIIRRYATGSYNTQAAARTRQLLPCPRVSTTATLIMTMNSITIILIPLIFVCKFMSIVEAIPMMTTIQPYADECFFLRLPSSPKPRAMILTGSYEMFDEVEDQSVSAKPLLVYVMEIARVNTDSKDAIIWQSAPNEPKGNFRAPITSTKRGYWLCFQNSNHAPDNEDPEDEHPDHIERIVGFDYKVHSIVPDVKPAPLLYTNDHTDEWRDKSDLVQAELRQLMSHRDFMHMREGKHRQLVEYTFDDIMAWTIIETTFVVLVAVCQVLYFRRFIEKKQRY